MVKKRLVEVRDLAKIRAVSDPQISPDGRRVAFVHTTVDFEKDTYINDVWLADPATGKSEPFTQGRGKDKNPRWSPDGKSIAFVSTPPAKEGEKKKPQLYVIPLAGGEARKLTEMEGGVEAPKWSPDGKRIMFTSNYREKEPETDVKVITRIGYRFNAKGYYDGRRRHLFVVPVRGGKPKQLTKGEYDVDAAEWVDDSTIALISNLEKDAEITGEDYLYAVDLKGGEPKKLTDGPRSISALKPSPLKDVIAYVGHDYGHGAATKQSVWLVPVAGGPSINLTQGFKQDVGNKLSCDVRVASPSGVAWTPDAEYIMFLTTYKGVAFLQRVPAACGKVEPVLGKVDHSVEAWSMSKNGVIAYTTLKTTAPPELWVLRDGKSKQLTNLNKEYLAKTDVIGHERFEFTSSGGHVVEGWLMRPPSFRKNRKYPLVLEIHGGPRSAYGNAMMHEFQLLAAQGWAVAYVNPWGSGGYDEDFQTGLPEHYGEQDYADIIEAMDYICSKYPFIDSGRLGVTGGSYGGFMTNWIITHTDRFKAAVTRRSISNWLSFFGCSDIGWTFSKWEMGGLPWLDEEKYLAKSPIRYVKNVKTPTMVIHSEEDYRCPISEGEQLFTALKYLGVPTELVRFPGENHELSRSGAPKHREQNLNHIIRWFKTYI
jgi:dipeptidyl aminopeptidase/acylaminoacyl peptidase